MGLSQPSLTTSTYEGNYANVLFFAGIAVLLTLGASFMACKYYNDYESTLKNRLNSSLNRRIKPKKLRTSTKNGNIIVFTQKLWLGKTSPTTLLDRSKLSLSNDQDDNCDEYSLLTENKSESSVSSVDRSYDIVETSPEIFV